MSMDTNDLITVLSQTAPPRKPLPFAVVLAALCGATAFVTFLVLGPRSDLATGITNPAFLLKSLSLLAAVIITGLLIRRSATPLPRMEELRPLVWGFAVLMAGAIGFEWLTTPTEHILALFPTSNFITCLVCVLIYGSVGAVGLVWLMRFYAPAHSKTAATVIGLAAAATGALGYSLHCPFDSPTFIAVAYGLPVLVVTLMTRRVAVPFIRW